MTQQRVALGLAVAACVGLVVVIAIRRLRRRLTPDWSGLEALLADAVLAIGFLVFVANGFGLIGWFAPWPLAAGLVLLSFPLWVMGWSANEARERNVEPVSGHPAPRSSAEHDIEPDWVRWAVAIAGGIVAAAWLRGLPAVLRDGILEWDALWYHLPVAADLVRSGEFLPIRFYGADIQIATYPFGGELFHAVGMLIVGSDLLSPFVNLGWAALYLIASHIVGRRFRCPHMATLGALFVLSLPIVLEFEALNAKVDIMAIALVAAIVGIAVQPVTSRDTTGASIVAGAALGLLVSVKLTMLPVAVVLVVMLTVVRRRRVGVSIPRFLLPVCITAFATGAFWYLRNWYVFGNPIPQFGGSLGPIRIPMIEMAGSTRPMIRESFAGIRDGELIPLIQYGLGPLWLLVLASPFVLLTLMVRNRRSRTLFVLSLASMLIFALGLLTPQFPQYGPNATISSDMRYLLAGFVMVMTATILGSTRSRVAARNTAVVLLVVIVTTIALGPGDAVNRATRMTPIRPAVVSSVLVVCLFCLMVVAHRRLEDSEHAVRWFVGGTAIAACCALVALQPTNLPDRYRTYVLEGQKVWRQLPDLPSNAHGHPTVWSWAQDQHDLRIAVQPYAFADFMASATPRTAGGEHTLLFTYPLYGRDLSTRVESVAFFDGTLVVPADSCSAWWEQLERFKATHVVVWDPGGSDHRPYRLWTELSPSASIVARSVAADSAPAQLIAFELGPHDTSVCEDRRSW